jgi:hypothetical protein
MLFYLLIIILILIIISIIPLYFNFAYSYSIFFIFVLIFSHLRFQNSVCIFSISDHKLCSHKNVSLGVDSILGVFC